jgi:hypothetical protein
MAGRLPRFSRTRTRVAALALFAVLATPGAAFADQTPGSDESVTGDSTGSPPPRLRRPGLRRPGAEQRESEAEATEARPEIRRPGNERSSVREPENLPPPLPVPNYEVVPISDRWRVIDTLGNRERWYDPYHQNTLKGDRPIFGTQDVFFQFTAISDTLVEPRRIPTPVGANGTRNPGSLDVFANGTQLSVVQNLIVSAALTKGDTVFRPPDLEFRVTAVGNYNYTKLESLGGVRIDPTRGRTRSEWHVGIQDLFLDYHIRNTSDRYDFDSIRVGIQPFTTDFRGFLFQDNQPGVRFFGSVLNNRLQYNLAWFRRLEKDINSGLNTVFEMRPDDVVAANVYYQDFPVLGFTLQGTAVYNANREGDKPRFFDENGFLQRPAPIGDARGHDYDVGYFGLNGDGHFDRLNLTFSVYYATGRDERNPIAQQKQRINAWMTAFEGSYDFDWYRLKAFLFYSTGDENPFDEEAGGFDTIFDNPQFAGADTSFFQRQAIPFIGGAQVMLAGRNSLVPSLRTSKEQGQSNFVNPGLLLVGIGADLDVLPELRVTGNISYLRFDDTAVLETLRPQGKIDKEIGTDLSLAFVYRPLFINNVTMRLAGSALLPGDGFRQLFDDRNNTFAFYSVLANVILTY